MQLVAALALISSLAGSTTAFAQAAEGSYPGMLFCEAGAGSGAIRIPIIVEIARGRASYDIGTAGLREKGVGALAGSQLVLTGRGTGRTPYEARYVGQVSGRGGLLTGTQSGKGFSRSCQMSIGQGRA